MILSYGENKSIQNLQAVTKATLVCENMTKTFSFYHLIGLITDLYTKMLNQIVEPFIKNSASQQTDIDLSLSKRFNFH